MTEVTGLNHPDKRPENQYKKGFFKTRYKFKWRAPIVCRVIKEILNPGSVIDVGCATGDLIAGFRDIGINAYGIEGSKNCIEYLECQKNHVHIHDLRIPLLRVNLTNYDLVTCFEVAEHIEPEYADIFVDNLCKLSCRILMSAAPPGVKGHHHYNCQPAEYWNDKFSDRGYFRSDAAVLMFRQKWLPWKNKPGIKAYYDNLLYFQKR